MRGIARGGAHNAPALLVVVLSGNQTERLSAGERKMYLTARQVLVAELAASSGRGEEEFLTLVGGA